MEVEETYIDPEVKELRNALHVAWVLIGRCDLTFEELEERARLSGWARDAIQKRRAEILHAMGSAQ